jgi:hypothetical protein
MPYSNKNIRQQYKKQWQNDNEQHIKQYWQQNKDRYKYRWLKRLGTNQDKEVLEFIKKKRMGLKVPKYTALHISQFKYNNQALLPRYADIRSDWLEIKYE